MRLFFIQVVGSTLFATLTVAEHKWPGSNEYYGYRGPPAPIGSDGRVIDTPEVAHARAAHLATHAEVSASMAHNQQPDVWEGSYEQQNSYEEPGQYVVQDEHQRPYHGPPAPIGHDGRVIDTPEVAHAKAVHLAALARAAAEAPLDHDYHAVHNDVWSEQPIAYGHNSPKGYKGPLAPLAPDGRVIDTPEVAQAKAAHLRAHAYAAALTAHRERELYY